MGPTLAGGAGPGRPRPAQPVRFSTAGPELDPACDIPISRAVGAARPGPRGSNLTGRLPGLAREICSEYFCSFFVLFLFSFEVSWPHRAR